MVFDTIENLARYAGLNPLFAEAVRFLRRPDLADLPAGRQEIDGDRLYANVIRAPGRTRAGAVLEAHRRYIDIQVALSGADVVGWKPADACQMEAKPYDETKDTVLYADAPVAWHDLPAGTMAIYFPRDAHAPMGGAGDLHKVVVKVADARDGP